MPYQNIDATLSDTDRGLIINKIDEILALMPFAVNLSKGEKRNALQLGAKGEKFFVDVAKVITTTPEFKPPFVDKTAYTNDLDLYIALLLVELKVNQLVEIVGDTRAALAQEMMRPGLAVYSQVKQAALSNVPGADTALNTLKPYFKKERKKK